ncbi:MAG: hypothetical protein ABFS10_15285 [Bacteroidota bacterium]
MIPEKLKAILNQGEGLQAEFKTSQFELNREIGRADELRTIIPRRNPEVAVGVNVGVNTDADNNVKGSIDKNIRTSIGNTTSVDGGAIGGAIGGANE